MKLKSGFLIISVLLALQSAFSQEGGTDELIYPLYRPAREFQEKLGPEAYSDLQQISEALLHGMNERLPYDDMSHLFPMEEGFGDYESFIADMIEGNDAGESADLYQSLVEYNRDVWADMIPELEGEGISFEFLDIGIYNEEEGMWYLSLVLKVVATEEIFPFPILTVMIDDALRFFALNEGLVSFSY